MDKVEPGHRPITRTTSRFVSEAFSFLDENDFESVNIKDDVLKDTPHDHTNDITNQSTSSESISNVNGVYTIVTSVQEKPPPRCEPKPLDRPGKDDVFRIVDFISNRNDRDLYINPVYVVDEDEESTEVQANLSTGQTANVSDKDASTDKTSDATLNGSERNSVIIDGEEVFLRKSPRERQSRSSRSQSWKNNQNFVSKAFGFLKDASDIDDTPSNDIDVLNDENDVKLPEEEQLSRSARQPTWRTNQRVVSEAFGFLQEAFDNEERLSSTSIGVSTEHSSLKTSAPASSNHTDKSDLDTVNIGNDIAHNQESSSESLQHNLHNIESNSQLVKQILPKIESNSQTSQLVNDPQLPNQIEESESTNQSDSSVLSNQSRASDASSIMSEDVGDLGGFKKSKFNSNNRDDDGGSSDEDVGVYRESFRRSTWLYVGDKKNKGQTPDNYIAFSELGLNTCDTDKKNKGKSPDNYIAFSELGLNTCDTDSVFGDNSLLSVPENNHLRNESTSTTVSEREFRNNFNSVSKRFVQRADSQQEYKRYTQAFYDNVTTYSIEKTDRDSFGIHILDSKPAVVSGIDAESPAERAGLKEGQVVIAVNGVNVLDKEHDEIIQLVQKDCINLTLEVGSGDLSPVLNLQLPVVTGFMQKQVSSTIFRLWKKRYFILRRDNCLYYYKNEQDTDPLGAIPLHGYTVSRHGDPNKFAFKAEKYNCKTYFFLVDSRDDMTRWVGALNEAGKRYDERKDAWMEVTANNVGLPALDIRKPDCTGYLNKMGRATKRWRKRYCVLKDACIYYYKNMNSKEAEGVAHLHGYVVDKLGMSTKKFSFCLEPPEKQMRVFTFYAENETDKNRWIDALNSSIQKWIKVD